MIADWRLKIKKTRRNHHMDFPKANILIVDDTPENLRLLMGILNKQEYEVRPALDGLHALSTAYMDPPDLILLDIRMPGMDGYEVCERLKADPRTREIPVLFISGLNSTLDKVKAFSVGALDYITKPFQPEEVVARVKTHLSLRCLHQRLQEDNTQLRQEITRRQQAEEELRSLNQQLQEANASKDTFFSIIAHDLRNPFIGLLGLTEAIVENFDCYPPDKVKAMMSRLHLSSKKLYALLTNLLTWSRLHRGLMDYEPEEIPIDGIVTHNVRLFASNAEQKQITLTNLVPEKTAAYGDIKMVDMIIRNLISNALKFTEAGGMVDICAQKNQHVIEIAVSDTGIGMNQACLDTLFRIEAKCGRTGTAGEEGTGLGLLLCKELVEKNGGKIWVESEVRNGSTFRFTLPREVR
jgi:signal transduction histidine kinase